MLRKDYTRNGGITRKQPYKRLTILYNPLKALSEGVRSEAFDHPIEIVDGLFEVRPDGVGLFYQRQNGPLERQFPQQIVGLNHGKPRSISASDSRRSTRRCPPSIPEASALFPAAAAAP